MLLIPDNKIRILIIPRRNLKGNALLENAFLMLSSFHSKHVICADPSAI